MSFFDFHTEMTGALDVLGAIMEEYHVSFFLFFSAVLTDNKTKYVSESYIPELSNDNVKKSYTLAEDHEANSEKEFSRTFFRQDCFLPNIRWIDKSMNW